MPIPVSCQCGQAFRAKDDLAGKKVKCPKCGQPIEIPGADPSGAASASGLVSIDDLMKMDAAAPTGPMPNMPGPGGMPGMPMQGMPTQQGMPAGFPQAGGYMPQGAGGFQAPNPFFAQAGAARPRSSGGNQGFKIAMLSLGGVGTLAVIAIVLIFVFRGDPDNTDVATSATNTPGTTTPGTNTPGTNTPGTNTPGTNTPGTTLPGTNTPALPTANTKVFRPQTYVHAGFDSPEAAFDGFLQAITNKDSTAVRAMMRDMIGPDWDAIEKAIEAEAQKKNGNAADAWSAFAEGAKVSMIGTIVQRRASQAVTSDLAVIVVEVKNPFDPRATIQAQKLVAKDGGGKWHLALEEGEHKTAIATFRSLGVGGIGSSKTGGPATPTGPTLASGLPQYYAQQKDLRGSWLVDSDDQPHMAWSWMAEVLPYIGHEQLAGKLDFKKQFFRDPNRQLANTVIPQFLNPADDRRTIKELGPYTGMALSHFVGMSGVEDRRQDVAGTFKRTDPGAGVFGYDRVAKPAEITDGTSNTIMVIGVDMPRPWIEGGGATIRGARKPYFGGATSQFGTRGQNGAITMMADGSVRLIASSVDEKVFRDLCTIRGGEKVDMAPFASKDDFFRGAAKKSP